MVLFVGRYPCIPRGGLGFDVKRLLSCQSEWLQYIIKECHQSLGAFNWSLNREEWLSFYRELMVTMQENNK